MKLTVKELLDLKPGLEKLIAQDLPVKVAYKVSKILKKLQSEYELFDSRKMVLFEKYGEKKEDGNVQVKNEHIAAFNKDFGEMVEIEIEADISKIKVEDLEGATMSSIDMVNLGVLIEE